jgi:hypothetical protein
MKRILFVILIITSSRFSYTQELFTTLKMPGKVDKIWGMMIDNDIFMSIEFPDTNTKLTNISYFIHPDGSKTEIDLTAIADKPIIGGIRRDGSTYFYYLDEVSKKAVVKCFVVDSSGMGTTLPKAIDVPGKIYGCYIERGDLFMLCAVKKKFTLKLLCLRDGILAAETDFPLTFDLGGTKETKVSFFDAALPTTPQQASAPIKIVKDKNLIWITIDEPYRDYGQAVTESSIFKTTVARLDLVTGKTSIKSFFEKQWYPFTSALLKGNLYRLVLEHKKPRVDIFNFENGQQIRTWNLLRGAEPGRDSTYARIETYLKTEKDVKGANVVKRIMGNLFIVDSLSANEQILTLGHYGDQVIIPTFGITPAVWAVMTATSLLVKELIVGRYSCVYYYYKGPSDDGYTATYHTPLLSQVIDDYEYNMLTKKIMFSYKGYLRDIGITYAIYQKRKSNELDIMIFKK